MVKNKREKNKIDKKERKYVYVQLANLAKVIKEDTLADGIWTDISKN